MTPPIVENAPGLVWQPRKRGYVAMWRARADLVKRGYKPKNFRIAQVGLNPLPNELIYIADRCRDFQSDMLVWGRGGIPLVATFDGTIRALIDCYRSDEKSPYRKLRYVTRGNYDRMLNRISDTHGDALIRETKVRKVMEWHDEWTTGGKLAMGHSLITMLRTLLTFGAGLLEDEHCEKLVTTLSRTRFEMGKRKADTFMTAEQADAIRAQAHAAGWHSMALAEALQFECTMRQKDAIGEWVPINEPGMSGVTYGNLKWLRGLRWSEIDAGLIARHQTSKKLKDIEIDLKLAPMVMEELTRLAPSLITTNEATLAVTIHRDQLPTDDSPVIVSEATGRPWVDHEFRRRFREIRKAAGVPYNVKSMHSRHGAISEATEAGAPLEHVRHAATHSDIATTQIYSRGSTDKIASVMKLRVAHRNKPRTE